MDQRKILKDGGEVAQSCGTVTKYINKILEVQQTEFMDYRTSVTSLNARQ